jgi:hypothetical protein
VSPFSDAYGVRLNTSSTKTLIVDGFDRTESAGSYHLPSHTFAMTQGSSIPQDFSTCANDAVIDGSVLLQNYQVVVWVLGDESSADETFNASEQNLVAGYLQNGGKLFVSGSEVAYDLDRASGPTQADRDFLQQYLKVSYAGDDANEYTVAGASSSIFQNLTLRYGIVNEGSPYEEDWPDFITPANGSSVVLHYVTATSAVYAGAAFTGVFPNGTRPGAVILVGFPFETITTKANRDSLMRRVYEYFGVSTGIGSDIADAALPRDFELQQNYPNPFNPTTNFEIRISKSEFVSLRVYDILGREVETLVNEVKEPGTYTVQWDASRFANGVYFYTLDAGNYHKVRKMILVK